ncbi:hypothetical protein AK88_00487 [Plasmodium fragile]|uniref:Uncharacterized protein n=1 Tax=Plasmodium fragile TaxID=5857 RepID=A0A0D9QRT9_PLAFR|nr:uncharacterized protein AK88_00487 [Plasmodium fragile]KJP89779.1 hypothetical protein AK88_00487 [Plasmodium fragile]
MPLSKRNYKILRSLARTVGKLCQFYDDNQVWKSMLSSAYRYENEKCNKYNDFLKTYLSGSVHYCPTKSSKKKLRGELFKYLRANLKNGGKEHTEDVFLLGFTAIRHLGRVKNSLLLALSSTGDLPITHRYNHRVCVPRGKNIWHSDEEKDMFRRNLHVVNFGSVEQDEVHGEGSSAQGKKRSGAYRKGESGQPDGGNTVSQVGRLSEASGGGEADNNASIPVKRSKNSIVLKRVNHKQEIKKGMILVAHPLTSSTLWNRSIILITHRDKSNLVCGIILNKHPLYNSYMGITNEKEIVNILNKLYLKKQSFLTELGEASGGASGAASGVASDPASGAASDPASGAASGESQVVADSSGSGGSGEVAKATTATCPVEEGKPPIDTAPMDANRVQTSASKDNQPRKEEDGLVLLQNQCIAKEEEQNVVEKKYPVQTRRELRCDHQSNNDEFPTLKDLQEMFLRIQFRSSSKHDTNRQRKQKNVIAGDGSALGVHGTKKNSLFVMMDEHLLDIITHYIIKLNKVPIYLRFLPSYNIGSIIDIKKEIKKLQFLNEFYKIYFEQYNKWKVVVINNRIHIFDKEKKKKKKKKKFSNVRSVHDVDDTGSVVATDAVGEEGAMEKVKKTRKLTEEEIQKIHKKIKKFQETNMLCDDEVEEEEEDKGRSGGGAEGCGKRKDKQKGQRRKSDGRKSGAVQQPMGSDVQADDDNYVADDNCVAGEDHSARQYEDYEEEEEEDDDDDEDEEEDEEEEEEDDDEGEEEVDVEEEEGYQHEEEESSDRDRLAHVHNTTKQQEQVDSATQVSKSKVDSTANGSDAGKKNHLERNPLSFFWLGGPLPGLTILHNIKKFSKNTVVNDFIYEGYNENVNSVNASDVHEADSNPHLLATEDVPLDEAKKENASTQVHDLNEENQPERATSPHTDPIYLEGDNSHKEKTGEASGEENKLVKRFIGKATWDINQLRDELNNDYWIALNCHSKELLSSIIFNTAAGGTAGSGAAASAKDGSGKDGSSTPPSVYKGEFLWEKIVASISSDYESISNIPQGVVDSVLRDFRGAERD